MATTEHDLLKYDEFARDALAAVHRMDAAQQENLLLHIFRVAALYRSTGDDAVAAELCRDLHSTAELHMDSAYIRATSGGGQVDHSKGVTIDAALARLAAL